ncbi:MAG: hypothetical protein HQL76_07915 [Magnetococcales bacterium]|nr:hypothetical protein [Magnetococcales bacterium]
MELSLVLIIITLLLGTVLRGESLVEESRLHRLALDQAAIATAVRSYARLYHFIPGDDPKAHERWPEAENGNGDGRISDRSSEETQVWRHLRLAHLFIPKVVNQGIAQHILGGDYHLIHQPARLPDLALCMDQLLPEQAASYDSRHDDGDGREGNIRNPGPIQDDNDSPPRPWPPAEGGRVRMCVGL